METPKFRVGRKNKIAILYVETGKEYLVFQRGDEAACQEYCDYLNQKHKQMKKQSSVAWLYEQLNKGGVDIIEIFEKANEMHKEEIIKAHEEGQAKEAKYQYWSNGALYYFQTFKT